MTWHASPKITQSELSLSYYGNVNTIDWNYNAYFRKFVQQVIQQNSSQKKVLSWNRSFHKKKRKVKTFEIQSTNLANKNKSLTTVLGRETEGSCCVQFSMPPSMFKVIRYIDLVSRK